MRQRESFDAIEYVILLKLLKTPHLFTKLSFSAFTDDQINPKHQKKTILKTAFSVEKLLYSSIIE